MILGRRAFLTGLIAAPVIIRPGILMPVKPLAVESDPLALISQFPYTVRGTYEEAFHDMMLYGVGVVRNLDGTKVLEKQASKNFFGLNWSETVQVAREKPEKTLWWTNPHADRA